MSIVNPFTVGVAAQLPGGVIRPTPSAPATSAITIGGITINLSDWLDDKVYSTVAISTVVAPTMAATGDARRWPDIWADGYNRAFARTEQTRRTGVRDPDLWRVVHDAMRAPWQGNPETEHAMANVIDVAIEEQARRDHARAEAVAPSPDGCLAPRS